ncbi:hypothetical protein MGN70_009397 [Eutypa lata]|nr:hypothetical protein MGN70_009397 [Eutypa lata]
MSPRDEHLKEEATKRLQQRQLASTLQQHFEQSLTHSRAEDDATFNVNSLNPSQPSPISKHKDRDGYHCPREDCYVRPAAKLPGFREHYGTRKSINNAYHAKATDALADIKYERPCPICLPPWASRTLIEWIRHVRRHQELESTADTVFIQEKCAELIKYIDANLLRVDPCPPSLRYQRTRKRTQETAGIDTVPAAQRPKLRHEVTRSRLQEAMQPATEANTSIHGVLETMGTVPGYGLGTLSSSIEQAESTHQSCSSLSDHHEDLVLSSQHVDPLSFPGQMADPRSEGALAASQTISVGSKQGVGQFALPVSLSLDPEMFPAIYAAMNYPSQLSQLEP